MEIYKDSEGVVYELVEVDDGEQKGFVIESNGTQIIRVERNRMTGERYAYTWDGAKDDYASKVKFNPFHRDIEKERKEWVELIKKNIKSLEDELKNLIDPEGEGKFNLEIDFQLDENKNTEEEDLYEIYSRLHLILVELGYFN